MKLIELEFGGEQPPIDGYAPGGFRVGGVFRDGAALLSPEGLRPWSAPQTAAELDEAAAKTLFSLAGAVDLLLIGLGPQLVAPPQPFRLAMERDPFGPAGAGVEWMSTPSACRTYNVLLSEGRRVGAALLTV